MINAAASSSIIIDNGEPVSGSLEIEQNYETIESLYGTKPDPAWEFIDEAGHFHAYDTAGELPTLDGRARHVNCDGSCGGVCGGEGYNVTDWHCRICDQLIEPGQVDDRGPHQIATWRSWAVVVESERTIEGRVTVRIRMGDRVLFGVADASTTTITHALGRTTITTKLFGYGALGQRAAA